MSSAPATLDLNHLLYRTALAGIQRAYVFMRFGVQGVSVVDFDDTELPGRLQIGIVPEPMPKQRSRIIKDYVEQFRPWIVGNGLRELVCLGRPGKDHGGSFYQLSSGRISRHHGRATFAFFERCCCFVVFWLA
jgi:hypothetical protein